MTFRVVAIPLIAAICLGSPASASPNTDDQQVRGRGARDRSGDNNGRRAEARGGGDTNRTASRREDGDQRRAQDRDRNRDQDRNRNRDRDRDRDDRPIIITRSRPSINVNIGSAYRGSRYYAPWSGFYGALGFSSFGYYGPGFSPYPVYGSYGYGYGYAGPGAYSPWQATGYDIGGIRLKIRPRDAQVFVDGYYAGVVDDFDGTFQSLRLEQGGHKIEIHMPGFQDLELDVHVQSGKTITLNEDLRPRP